MSDRKSKTIRPAAQAAANWWAEQVGAPIFVAVGPKDSPEDRRNMDFTGAMQSMIAADHPVSDEAGQRFARELAETISDLLDKTSYGVSLGVDYGPDLILGEAADAAGINLSRFPWKTHMWVKPDHVTAGLGYGARSRLIWSSPDWERPVCGEHEWSDDGPGEVICGLPKYHDGDHGEWKDDPDRCVICGLSYAGHYRDGDRTHAWDTAKQGAS